MYIGFFTIVILTILAYALFKRLMNILLYLNFKINVLQHLLLENKFENKDIINSIDKTIANDYMADKTIEAVKYGTKLGIFDTVDDMHHVYNSEKIIDRFNEEFKEEIKNETVDKLKK
jgi:hypothetical protein